MNLFNAYQTNHLDEALQIFYPYQSATYEHTLLRGGSTIPYMEMGLGKSIIALAVAMKLGAGKILVLCSRNAMNTWRKEAMKWCGVPKKAITIIQGQLNVRGHLWNDNACIHIATFRGFHNDLARGLIKKKYDILIGDEAHKARNRTTQSFKGLKQASKFIDVMHLPTGSLLSKGVQDAWGLLNILNPQEPYFKSYYRFIHKFCRTQKMSWGTEIIGPRNLPELTELLKPYIKRSSKKDPEIAKTLPSKRRILLPVKATNKIMHLYRELERELILVGEENITVSPNKAVNHLRLRQLLACPALLDPSFGLGIAFETVLARLKDSDNEDERHVALFTPFRQGIILFKEALEKEGFKVVTFMGGMDPDELNTAEKTFASEKCISIGTYAYAQSYDLSSCSYFYGIGQMFIPDDNIQAEDRVHRRTSKYPVVCYYLIHEDTIEEDIFDVLDNRESGITLAMERLSR